MVEKQNIKIRLATEDDFEPVSRIFAEENQYHAELVPDIVQVADPIMTPEWFQEVLSNPVKKLFLAAINTEVVGLILVSLRTSGDDPIFKPRRFIYINEIAVAEAYRGQGIGGYLLGNIHQWALDKGIAEIELQVWERNERAIKFYEKSGYKPFKKIMRCVLSDYE